MGMGKVVSEYCNRNEMGHQVRVEVSFCSYEWAWLSPPSLRKKTHECAKALVSFVVVLFVALRSCVKNGASQSLWKYSFPSWCPRKISPFSILNIELHSCLTVSNPNVWWVWGWYILENCFPYFSYFFVYLFSSNFRLSFSGHEKMAHRDNAKF